MSRQAVRRGLVALVVFATGATVGALPAGAPPPPLVIGAPIDVKAVGVGTEMYVDWKLSPINTTKQPVTGWTINFDDPATALNPDNTTSYGGALPGSFGLMLKPGVTYTITVHGGNAVNVSPDSAPITAGLTPSTDTPFLNQTAMVDRLYQDLVGRLPTTDERNGWLAKLMAGTATRADIVVALRLGPESKTNVDPVTRLYLAYFLRAPDVGGLSFWVKKKRSGTSLDTISAGFAGSSEFKTTYGALSNEAFVNLVYKNVLGRPGEASGVAFWTGQINMRKRTRGQVMTGFSESNEYKVANFGAVNVAVVEVFLLQRVDATSFVSDAHELQTATGLPEAALKVFAGKRLGDPNYGVAIYFRAPLAQVG